MPVSNVQESTQNLIPLKGGTLDTENTSNPFFVPQSSDEEFNARMRENELYPSNLRDIHVQEFMDKGYEKNEASQRVSQYAFMGALEIPGQLNVFNQFFDENASEETKDTFRATLKSSFDKMSNSDISLATAEMLPTIQMSGSLTRVSSQVLIKNEIVPVNLSTLDMSPAASEARYIKAMTTKHEFFLLGPKVYYDEEMADEPQPAANRPEFSSSESIKKFFEDIVERLTNKENNPEIKDEEKKTITRSKDIFERLVRELGYVEKEKLEEIEKNEILVNQYTKNNKPNPIEEKQNL